jgi:NAD(P)-dependent dehydrogenase (short-subunit alcohol dehydrogenase family)
MGRPGDRAVIITGAARGIGATIAEQFAATGTRVGVVDRDPGVRALADRLDGSAATVDLADTDATRRAIGGLVEQLGGCWCLVNNAGVFAKSPLLELDLQEFDRMMAVNARAMIVTTQAVAPSMIEAGEGRIVNLASMAAKLGTPGETAYAASKAAVVAITRIAAMELGPHGITVNAICPGYVLTEMGADSRDPEQISAWTAKSPLGRLASPDDVAATVLHLASNGAGYVTGQALNVTGGMCTW